MIIGLSGYARSGKDEAAKVLVEQHGFTRIAFADKLRDFLYALNPLVSNNLYLKSDDIGWHLWGKNEPMRVRDVIDYAGWDGYKESPYGQEIRELLQRLGTEAGRQVLGENIWVDSAFIGLDPNKNYVITDVRFPNEAEAVRERGGCLWRINRAGIGPANNHASELSLDDYQDFHQYLNNDGAVEEYHEKVNRSAVRWLETFNSIKEQYEKRA
jgi:hypothetical protein